MNERSHLSTLSLRCGVPSWSSHGARAAHAAAVGLALLTTLSAQSRAELPLDGAPGGGTKTASGPLDAIDALTLPGTESDDGTGAEVYAERGRDAVKREDFETAHEAFREAFRRSKHYALAGSLAVVEMKLGRYADAAVHWEFFLQHLEETALEKRTAVMAQLEACRKQLGRVAVKTNAPGAVLVVDGKVIGPLPRDVWLASGPHRFVARLENRLSPGLHVDVAVGREGQVSLELPEPTVSAAGLLAMSPPPPLREDPSARVLAPPEAPQHSALGPREYVLLGGAALTLAGAVTGGVGLWQAHARSDEADTLVGRIDAIAVESGRDPDTICTDSIRSRPDECAELDDVDWRRARMETVAAVGFLSAAGVALATGVTYWLWPSADELARSVPPSPGSPAGPRGARDARRTARARWSSHGIAPSAMPWATPWSAGVVLGLRWW